MLTSSLNLINDLVVDDFVSNLERLVFLVLLASQQHVIHSEAPAIKLSDAVPSEGELATCRDLSNQSFGNALLGKYYRPDAFYVCVFLLVFFIWRNICLITAKSVINNRLWCHTQIIYIG